MTRSPELVTAAYQRCSRSRVLSILPVAAQLSKIVSMTLFRHIVPILLIAAISRAFAGEWPKNYILQENSKSPDGHYVILVQSRKAAEEQDTNESDVYLADVKAHTTLGKIDNVDYFENQNHAGLEVFWAPDSNYCVVENDGRYGAGTISVLETKDSRFAQTEIGDHIQKAIDAVIAKQAHEREVGGYVSPLFRIEPGRKIRVYATALTNPKQLEDAKSYFALFRGLYDLSAKKWIQSQARPLTSKENDLLDSASTSYDADQYKVSPEAFKDLNADAEEPQILDDNVCFRSEQSEFKYLDDKMNEVYKAARLILSPSEFAKVQGEQREWLKKRDVAGSLAEKSKLTIARIDALQDASW